MKEQKNMKKENLLFISKRAVTIGLIIINILIFIISAFTGDLLYNKGAFSLRYLLYGKEWWRLITSMFLHADINHLTGNMLLLYLAGEVIEQQTGKWKFFILYFFSDLTSSFLYAAYEYYTGSYMDSIGASGAVFGIVGALLVMTGYHKGRYGDITIGRILFMIIYMIYTGLHTSNVNNAAHVGGLTGGILLMCLYVLIDRIKWKRTGGSDEN